ncbi:HD domain-containing protein, partial [Candidatus Dependentiae bacterium]|nr:HD domain-containing protein [Candidatus Dependentiae bacterium]
ILKIVEEGGVPYLVGGTVRDLALNEEEIKDVDIEVHKLSLGDLEKILKNFGHVRLVGKKFGVLRIDGLDVDWSLPRKDSKGRKPKVEIDPNMTIKEALRRRDLTINAMAINLKKLFEKEKIKLSKDIIIDPYNGLSDLKDKKLRVVDKKLFLEDPLRFFRVMQFIGRFEMYPDQDLNEICRKMDLEDFSTGKFISKERIFEELKKLFLKSKRPSLAFRWLKDIGRLKDVFPEIYALVGVDQRKDYHPEGTVFEHTMQAIDAAAILDKYNNKDEKLIIMFAVLCHDFGKPKSTDIDLSTKGHEKVGVPITKKFLKRITDDKFLISTVSKLVLYHTRLADLVKFNSSLKAYKRLALKLAPQTNIYQLGLVSFADLRGRNSQSQIPLKKAFIKHNDIMEYDDVIFEQVLTKLKEAKLEKGPEEPILKGRHLLEIIEPGPQMGKILKKAYEIQIEEDIKDIEELKKRVFNSKKRDKF